MKKLIILLGFLCLLLGGCSKTGQDSVQETKTLSKSKKYEICGEKVKVQEIYFNNEKGFQCSAQNPYWDELLAQIELISKKEKVDPIEYEFDPEITVVCDKGLTFELADGTTTYAYPAVEGAAYENRDKYAYYIRVLKEGKQKAIFYFERDEDVIHLRELMQAAIQFEYDNAPEEGIEAVVVMMSNNEISRSCIVRSEEYGEITLFPEDFDHVIVGDTIKYKLLDEEANTGINAEIKNLTQNDLSASKQSYIKVLPYSYEVMSYKKKTDIDFRTDRLELEYDYDDWHFVLGLESDDMPTDVYQDLLDKYNSKFFESNILLYCWLKSTEVQVTAATQPMEEDMYYDNVISVKELTQEQVPEDEEHMLLVTIPRDEWNGDSFDLYVYE
ncbi:MAG: hypothetical protein IKK33_11160 [Lachnospiraceae bacterium]|nr:hypothetical protein [Lachnospiraceae bacterium]